MALVFTFTLLTYFNARSLYSAQKGGFMRDAATEGIAILFPDTSPRGAGLEDETASWDFGVGKSCDLRVKRS